ncbi:MAG: RtcB family protein [Pseudomonadota bacterium]
MITHYTGQDLIELGCEEGPALGKILRIVNASAHSRAEVLALIREHAPAPQLPLHKEPAPCQYNITATNDYEAANVAAVKETMQAVLRTPCVVEGAVMPDACPAGPVGTIPVGGVVAAHEAIIPGMHSADICCSLMATVFTDASPADVLNAAHKRTHFGPGGRDQLLPMPQALQEKVHALPYPGLRDIARFHTGTQGDGNHFLYVGTQESTGKTVMVTHHGSRGLGARVYKAGVKIAQRFRKKLSPQTYKANAWIPFNTDEGQAYWQTLQVVREWTNHNHSCLHDETLRTLGAGMNERFWNEHNFVFREQTESGNLFWHAKGATPIHAAFLPDTNAVQIVPLNMAEPILLVKGERNASNRGFAPHGAGRNMSRTRHKKLMADRSVAEIFKQETAGLDVRFYSGNTDISELPSAYKNAANVVSDMQKFSLAEVIDRILPYGSIMAGDWQQGVSWKQFRADKRNAKHRDRRASRRAARQSLANFDNED